MGTAGIERALVVTFDVCADRSTPGNTCEQERVQLFSNDGVRTDLASAVLPSIKGNGKHRFEVAYEGRFQGNFTVLVDGELLISYNVGDIQGLLGGHTNAWVGFTGATSWDRTVRL